MYASIDAADQRNRPFHQPGHFVQQAGIVNDGELTFLGERGDTPSDDPPAFIGVDDDAAVTQLVGPVLDRR